MKSNITSIKLCIALLSPFLFPGCDRQGTSQVQSEIATRKSDKEALDGLLPVFSQAWNSDNAGELRKLFDPDSKFSKNDFGWLSLAADFGKIEKTEIRKYIEAKKLFVVRVTYARGGTVPGTFAVKQDKTGNWLISDFNIDGQGEPELNE